jgi:hypothetical protein
MHADAVLDSESSWPLATANLTGLMQLGEGRPEVGVGLIDSNVATHSPDFEGVAVRSVGIDSPPPNVGLITASE